MLKSRKSNTVRRKKIHRNTYKRGGKQNSANNDKKSHIVRVFLEILNVVKLYHWKTRSFAQHKATDELYGKLNDNIDSFVEILLGKDESRIRMLSKPLPLIDANNTREFKDRIYEYREFLIKDISMYFDSKRDSDLLNIRDEILGNINQFLYLMTFDK